jgi:hypothetical protein
MAVWTIQNKFQGIESFDRRHKQKQGRWPIQAILHHSRGRSLHFPACNRCAQVIRKPVRASAANQDLILGSTVPGKSPSDRMNMPPPRALLLRRTASQLYRAGQNFTERNKTQHFAAMRWDTNN